MIQEMNEERAREELKDSIRPDNGLCNTGHYIDWVLGDAVVTLDDNFTADELEAIVWWMRNKGKKT